MGDGACDTEVSRHVSWASCTKHDSWRVHLKVGPVALDAASAASKPTCPRAGCASCSTCLPASAGRSHCELYPSILIAAPARRYQWARPAARAGELRCPAGKCFLDQHASGWAVCAPAWCTLPPMGWFTDSLRCVAQQLGARVPGHAAGLRAHLVCPGDGHPDSRPLAHGCAVLGKRACNGSECKPCHSTGLRYASLHLRCTATNRYAHRLVSHSIGTVLRLVPDMLNMSVECSPGLVAVCQAST